MSSSLYQIEKLDDSNYESWKVQMKSVLIHSDLWTHVSGEIKSDTTDDKERKVWKSKDEKALATITLCIKPSQLNHIKNCNTSMEAWKRLQEIHQPTGPVRKVTLFKQLLQLKMNDHQAMVSHLNAFFEISEKLCEIGVELQDELLAIIMLSSLPESYENFVVAMETRDDLPSTHVLKTKLLEEGQRRLSDTVTRNGETAFLTKANSKARPNTRQYSRANRNKAKCYKCNKQGHFAAECRSKTGSPKVTTTFAMLNAVTSSLLNSSTWVLDSGSTCHMSCNVKHFHSMRPHKEQIELAANTFIESAGIGEVTLTTDLGKVKLRNVLYVPKLKCNFLSISKATEHGHFVEFSEKGVIIKDPNGEKVMCASKTGNLFVHVNNHSNEQVYASVNNANQEFLKWHARYGHLNPKNLIDLVRKDMVHGMKLNGNVAEINCEICLTGKLTRKPIRSSENKLENRKLLDLVHSDLCGPIQTSSLGGSRYFLTFIDDASRMIFVYFIKEKSEVLDVFKKFKNFVERQTGNKIKMLRSDNGREYINKAFERYLSDNGIGRQLSVPYTPQQNGVAERANRTIVESARCMLLGSDLPPSLWAEAVNSAVYLRNRSPTKSLCGTTPYESWYGRKPTVGHLKVFGCKAFMLDKRPQKGKFAPRGIECQMVGYCQESKAYRLYVMEQKRIFKSRDVKFLEEKGSFINPSSDNNDFVLVDFKEDFNFDESKTSENATNSTRHPKAAVDYKGNNTGITITQEESVKLSSDEEYHETECTEEEPFGTDLQTNQSDETELVRMTRRRAKLLNKDITEGTMLNFLHNDTDLSQNPKTVAEALSSRYGEQWRESMLKEYNTLMLNGTWELVDPPKGCHTINNKWVFSIKRDKDGNIEKFKSRLVAKGYSQKYGIEYHDTFSPVARYSTIRLIIAIAAEYNLVLHHMDVVSAYLNSELKEEVFMNQPELFVDPQNPRKVCKLKRAIYGLKQAGREWNYKLTQTMKKLGFKQCNADTCVFTLSDEKQINIIVVFVDDILIASSDEENLKDIKSKISHEFEVVDKGQIKYFLGMEIEQNTASNTIKISQRQLITELLKKNNMESCKECHTPVPVGMKFERCKDCRDCEKANQKEYQSLIGSLTYIAVSTRPDIIHSVNKLARFNSDPHKEHMSAARHLLKYIRTTRDYAITYKKCKKELVGYSDADWGGSTEDRKSFTGFIYLIGDGPVSWASKKQPSVALSTTEAEYMALAAAAKEAVYLRNFIAELGFKSLINNPTIINCDNLSAQHLVRNPVHHSRSKHIDIRHHYVREVCENSQIEIKYVSTEEMIADGLTKNLSKQKQNKFSTMLGLR